jgi:hypothetical protein
MPNTITLNGLGLKVTYIQAPTDFVTREWELWDPTTARVLLKKKVFGGRERWFITCWERNVTWTNSACKALKITAKAGSAVSLVIDKGDLYGITVNVYIVGVTLLLSSEEGSHYTSPLYREFTIECVEAQ